MRAPSYYESMTGEQIDDFEIGDWLIPTSSRPVHYPEHHQPEIFEFLGCAQYTDYKKIRAFPVYANQTPMVNRDKRPFLLLYGEWRKITDEEKAQLIAERIVGVDVNFYMIDKYGKRTVIGGIGQ